ncbi:nucleoside hydrolase [uncultured Cyclobacterium sp.]|uniref:nucleoside hydrolase n=1 Tax=uncultured Cyclobacterium sp. TaxID=453820 RepID=UPI0030ED90E7
MYKIKFRNSSSGRFVFGLLFLAFYFAVEIAMAQTEKVILDTDMGSDCDDVGAMALLHHFADQDKVEILGVIYSSGKIPYGVGIIDAINVYYGRSRIPVGASHDLSFGDPKDKMQAEKLAKDTIAYKNTLIHNHDAYEQTILNRRLLAKAPDNSVTYITIGHTKALYELLRSIPDNISPLNGFDLVSKKIKRWVALGALGASNKKVGGVKDWNFYKNNTAVYTDYLIDQFPKPAYFVDAGAKVFTGGSLETLNAGNIVRTAYRDWLWNMEKKTLIDQRPSWDLATVYYAVMGPDQYFEELAPGALTFELGQGSRWVTTEVNPLHHFIIQKQGSDKSLAKTLNTFIANQPLNNKLK